MSSPLLEHIRKYGFTVYTSDGQGLIPQSGALVTDWLSRYGDEPISVDVQTVSEYVLAQHKDPTSVDIMEELGGGLVCLPPYPVMFIQYDQVSNELRGASEGDFSAGRPLTVTYGCLVATSTREELAADPETTFLLDYYEPDAHWCVEITMVQYTIGRFPTYMPVNAHVSMDKDGRLIGDRPKFVNACHDAPVTLRVVWEANMYMGVLVALMACMFCHVRSSEVEEIEPTRAAKRKAKRKRKPLHRHHKLRLLPLEKHMRRVKRAGMGQGGGESGSKKALHLVRGHFAVYTPERPLLGKFVGQVWRAPHWRGIEDEGVVTKDYEVDIGDSA